MRVLLLRRRCCTDWPSYWLSGSTSHIRAGTESGRDWQRLTRCMRGVQVPLLSNLTDDDRAKIADSLGELSYSAGAEIVHEVDTCPPACPCARAPAHPSANLSLCLEAKSALPALPAAKESPRVPSLPLLNRRCVVAGRCGYAAQNFRVVVAGRCGWFTLSVGYGAAGRCWR